MGFSGKQNVGVETSSFPEERFDEVSFLTVYFVSSMFLFVNFSFSEIYLF